MVFELKSILDLQKHFVTDVANTYTGAASSTINTAYNGLNEKLNSLASTLDTNSASVDAALTRQSDVYTILTNEKTRLDNKKNSVENAHQSTLRSLELTENARKRQAGFIKVFIIIIGLTLLYVGLIQVNKTYPFPAYILEIIMVILFSLGGIYLYFVLRNIYKRSNMDFDKIDLPPPINSGSHDELKAAQEKATEEGNLSDVLTGESRSSFEVSGKTKWAEGIQKYVPVCSTDTLFNLNTSACTNGNTCTTGTTLCGGANTTQVCVASANDCVRQSFDGMSNVVKPYVPSEHNDYTFIR